jgi:hypothetical protein
MQVVQDTADNLVQPSAYRYREWALLCTWRDENIDRSAALWLHSSGRLFALHSTGYNASTYELEIPDAWINDVPLLLVVDFAFESTTHFLVSGELAGVNNGIDLLNR